jgi:hypothetical protein
MFVYVRAKDIIICPGYDAVVHVLHRDASKLKRRRKRRRK